MSARTSGEIYTDNEWKERLCFRWAAEYGRDDEGGLELTKRHAILTLKEVSLVASLPDSGFEAPDTLDVFQKFLHAVYRSNLNVNPDNPGFTAKFEQLVLRQEPKATSVTVDLGGHGAAEGTLGNASASFLTSDLEHWADSVLTMLEQLDALAPRRRHRR